MKNLKIWIFIILSFVVVGVILGTFVKIGAFGYVIGAVCALLIGILLFKKKAENENKDQVVFDEDKNFYR